MGRFLLALALLPAVGPAQGHIVTVSPPRLIHRVRPVYPPLAKQMRIQGTVSFTVVVGKDGIVDEIHFISGHPLLVQAPQPVSEFETSDHALSDSAGAHDTGRS